MTNHNYHPTLSLIGAGPGDPELISLKALKALESASVVLYDALVDPVLLKHAPEGAQKIFVGKRKGVCQTPQEQINELIVLHAWESGHVVRLKGGDPFVFGRGHEEAAYAKKYGVKVNVIPGISSFYSVPELQGIPLTRRGISESFWVITGTTRNHTLSDDVYLAAKSDATIVILMGMSQLSGIVEIFKNENKADLPVAIIQNGTREDEKIGMGTVKNILQEVEEKRLSSPAVIILGEVVKEHPEYIIKEVKDQVLSR